MMYMSIDSYEHFKSIIHPNIRRNINHHRDGALIHLPNYHGCHYANRNGIRKRIDYKRGQQCVLATDIHFWKLFNEIKKKYLPTKVYFTRYMSNLGLNDLAKTKGNLWYDWDKKNLSLNLIGMKVETLE